MSRADIVAVAHCWIGTPYRHRAATLGAGCDCLGLVRGVWREVYGSEPMELPAYRASWRDVRHADDMLAAAHALMRPVDGEPVAGQLLMFRLGRTMHPRHCGIAVSTHRFIHAQEGLGVTEANLTDGWRRRLAGLFDFPEL